MTDEELVKRFRTLQAALDHGCSDGGCVIEVTKGQHTNGGCKCLYQPSHLTLGRVGHMLRCAQDMADRIEELSATNEELSNCVAVLEDKLERAIRALARSLCREGAQRRE